VPPFPKALTRKDIQPREMNGSIRLPRMPSLTNRR
jgi:hypothetical protein